MMHQTLPVVALLATVAVMQGCGSTPAANFYSLSSAPAPATMTATTFVVVGPVTVPASVDRQQIVVNTGPNEATLDEFNRWLAPLSSAIADALAADLVAQLGTPNVTTSTSVPGDAGQFRVTVDVQKFESQPGVAASLDAGWTVRRLKDGASRSGRTAVREPVTQPGYAALAAAHSLAVQRLAQDVAAAVRALE